MHKSEAISMQCIVLSLRIQLYLLKMLDLVPVRVSNYMVMNLYLTEVLSLHLLNVLVHSSCIPNMIWKTLLVSYWWAFWRVFSLYDNS
jgi:hypothetical protein